MRCRSARTPTGAGFRRELPRYQVSLKPKPRAESGPASPVDTLVRGDSSTVKGIIPHYKNAYGLTVVPGGDLWINSGRRVTVWPPGQYCGDAATS